MRAVRRVTLAASTGLLVVSAGLVSPVMAHAETVRGVECTIVGTDGDDVLRGTADDDVICALGGDDVLIGLGGEDILIGGKGDDELRGGRGDDALIGGAGKDELVGGPGADRLTAGAATDNGRIVDILPVFKLPVGSKVEWTSLPSPGICHERAAGSWSYTVGDAGDYHFLLEGSAEPACIGKTVEHGWSVRITTPDRKSWTTRVDVAVKFASPSSRLPEGTTECASVSAGLTCAGATTTQSFTPLLPLVVSVALGPVAA